MAKSFFGEYPPVKISNDPIVHDEDNLKIKQDKNNLYYSLLYALRFAVSGIFDHTETFACLDEDLLAELKGIISRIFYERNPRHLNNKLHLINGVLIPHGFFLKVYNIQKHFRYLNLEDQESIKRKYEVTTCTHSQFNGMHTVRALHQDSPKKDFLPVYIFLTALLASVISTIFIFLLALKLLSLRIITLKIKPSGKKLTSVTNVIIFISREKSSTVISNSVQDVPVSCILFRMIVLKHMKII